jgi:hypothetical protein
MKTKMILLAALVGAAAMSAQAGVRFGFSVGLPQPVTPVVVAAPVAPCVPTFVQTIPACPGAGYSWSPGCWSYRPTGYAWVPGAWSNRPAHVEREHYEQAHEYAGRFNEGHRR